MGFLAFLHAQLDAPERGAADRRAPGLAYLILRLFRGAAERLPALSKADTRTR
ncbi:hypothetical protein C8N24_5970 [Solirubrobacter pauli]|uniref:Uncharacterized protein n=1 Tax=Solirubrobacter pauli TaxID=166793 RepID=A0A660L226_9ACTN|nr:hypothetical protein C8N24_5970 [Solirubrobacter pauli]